jgi:Ni/Co efflux regulator RcnB
MKTLVRTLSLITATSMLAGAMALAAPAKKMDKMAGGAKTTKMAKHHKKGGHHKMAKSGKMGKSSKMDKSDKMAK